MNDTAGPLPGRDHSAIPSWQKVITTAAGAALAFAALVVALDYLVTWPSGEVSDEGLLMGFAERIANGTGLALVLVAVLALAMALYYSVRASLCRRPDVPMPRLMRLNPLNAVLSEKYLTERGVIFRSRMIYSFLVFFAAWVIPFFLAAIGNLVDAITS